MSTNLLFKETDGAESIHKIVGMERKKKTNLFFACSVYVVS